MRTNHQPVDPDAKYEKSDFAGLVVVKAVGAFFVFTVLVYPLTWLFSTVIGADVRAPYLSRAEEFPVKREDFGSRRLPEGNNPILQDNITATADMRNLRREEQTRLNLDGIDPKTQKRVIPIEKAIEMEAERITSR